MKKYFFTAAVFFILVLPFFGETYKNKVIVSYYAEDFHGKKTSSGETYNMYDYTCANKELPFNTIVKVTNTANGKSVNVRVNDRGPFVPDREFDLSKSAATALGMIKSGTAVVNTEIISMGEDTKISRQTAQSAEKIMEQRYGTTWKKTSVTASSVSAKTPSADKKQTETKQNSSPAKQTAEPAKTSSSAAASKPAGTFWDFQMGSFTSKDNASRLAQSLIRDGFKNIVFQTVKSSPVIRVVIKNVPAEELESMKTKLEEKGYKDYLVKQNKSQK